MKTVKGRFVKKVIADNRLSSVKKYEAYRKANPKLALPKSDTVADAFGKLGWDWEIREGVLRSES